MNVFDIGIILIFVMFFISGFRKGIIKELYKNKRYCCKITDFYNIRYRYLEYYIYILWNDNVLQQYLFVWQKYTYR